MYTIVAGIVLDGYTSDDIIKTCESLKHVISRLCVIGNIVEGSTIIESWCMTNKIALNYWKYDFINYSDSYNQLLESISNQEWSKNNNVWMIFIEPAYELLYFKTDSELIYLTDVKKLEDEMDRIRTDHKIDGFRLQVFNHENVGRNEIHKVQTFTLGLIHLIYNWEYTEEPVSPHIYNTNPDHYRPLLDKWVLLRTSPIPKTIHMFNCSLLLEYQLNNIPSSRCVYMLGHTHFLLGIYNIAKKHYKQRKRMKGNFEEKWISCYRLGICYDILGKWQKAEFEFLEAWKMSPRCEPLIEMVKHYISTEVWHIAWGYLKIAIKMTFPYRASYWIDRDIWDYHRYSLMLRVARKVRPNDGVKALRYLYSIDDVRNEDKKYIKYYRQPTSQNEDIEIITEDEDDVEV